MMRRFLGYPELGFVCDWQIFDLYACEVNELFWVSIGFYMGGEAGVMGAYSSELRCCREMFSAVSKWVVKRIFPFIVGFSFFSPRIMLDLSSNEVGFRNGYSLFAVRRFVCA